MRQFVPQWRDETRATKYPFTTTATMRNEQNAFLVEGVFLDASFWLVGLSGTAYLTAIHIMHGKTIIYVGDFSSPRYCSAEFDPAAAIEVLQFRTPAGADAGVVVVDPLKLAALSSLGIGEHVFTVAQTMFCPTVVNLIPVTGVTGFVLEDGTLLNNDVWLLGDDGVVLRKEQVTEIDACGVTTVSDAIRIDVVGDPLFRRRLCEPAGLFPSPRFITKLRIISRNGQFECAPDAAGNIELVLGDNLATDTVLRINSTAGGLRIDAVGKEAQ